MHPVKRRLLKIYDTLSRAFGPMRWWPAETPFEVMVGAILTQNTAWTNVEKAIANLKARGLMQAERLAALDPAGLAALIRPAGYFNVKARRLRAFLDYFLNAYGGDVGRMRREEAVRLRAELLSVHGVGAETADSILLYALGKPVFVVDAYTRRVFHRLGLSAADASYDDLQRMFVSALPCDADLYNEYHALIVALGKDFCKPRPHCEACPLKRGCEYYRHDQNRRH
ncbi:MAG: endonuclease [Candidatus Handelsmanbacteria bacterium RIFCSPLOWO2_12_FULL_64_10]|uniref:Endonuclease n=1 Tax=Handelsmanbacteria sp. (strain RIFCSPLOWO2_12_FULL_64_10) TaxID=1817868 RepID=A0A1F6CXU9_HANXR|nr:MAG: endonuclease [Candidatus Handelsmanbacteria bacterium RIFCSPLOWO2_12_FULL_64_10]